MFKILKMLFRRRKYAPIYPIGGFLNKSDLYGRARSGEMVIDSSKFDIAKRCGTNVCENLKMIQRKSVKVTNCPNCGAVMHGNICDYCGTEL